MARARRAIRLRAAATGVAAREVAIFECARGPDVSGLFSEVAAVVGMLDHFEEMRRGYAGLRVEFRDGLYLDPTIGPNWWEYYFEPIAVGTAGPPRAISLNFHDWCAYRVERAMHRDRAAALVARHVVIKPEIVRLADEYVSATWSGGPAIGVHYRGTDKSDDAPRIPYDHMASVVRDVVRCQPDGCRIFLATDEQAFVEYMAGHFPSALLYRTMFRSTDGRPIDVVNTDGNYQKGLDAVLDCVLLSRTDFLIRTASNLSLCSTFFRPELPSMLLNPEP